MKHGAWLFVGALIAGCSDAPPNPGVSPDTLAVATSPADSINMNEPNLFDPGAIEIGDTVAGLVVVRKELNKVFEDSVWAGDVYFKGEIELSGVYQPHFDYPEVQALCFHTDSATAMRIPMSKPDSWSSANEKPWF